MSLHEENRARVKELQDFAQEPCLQFIAECFQQQKPFKIGEAFRSQKRHDQLWLIGRRGIPGERQVTWVKTSVHTKRLAIDIDPIATDGRPLTPARIRVLLSEIAEIGKKYGIVRPPATLSVGDFRHFELWGARVYRPELTEEQEKEIASKEISQLTGNIKERAMIRFRKRYGEEPRVYS